MRQQELTPEWLSEALGWPVAAVDATVVGTGQMGSSVRLVLTYEGDPPEGAPGSIVAKLPALDEKSRGTAAALRNYETETSFYRELAPQLPVRAPHCWYVDHDPLSDDFVLLLEDLSPAVQGDQLAGCSIEHAAIAVAELPKLHAPRWGDESLAAIPWLNRGGDDTGAFYAQLIGSLYPGFRERYAERLDADVLEMGDRFVPDLATYVQGRTWPKTVAHGDYRLDNLLFGTEEGGYPVAVVDWQTVTYGDGVSDLSYFIGAGLVTEDRRAAEEDLVRSYHEGMRAMGVDLSWDECWDRYRYYTFAGFLMAVAASQLVVRTERGDDMFVTMAQRHGRHVLDLEAEKLLG